MHNSHLSPGELLEAAADSQLPAAAQEHLDACPTCQAEVTELQNAEALFAPLRMNAATEPATHPSATDLANFAADVPADPDVLTHLAACSRCAAIVAAATPSEPDVPIVVKSATREWRAEMADAFRKEAKRHQPKPTPWRTWLAIAATLVLSVGIFGVWQRLHPDPATLLAQAYTEARPFEFRLPDNGYTELHIQKGATSPSDSEALFEARRALKSALAARRADPSLLALLGRQQLIERSYDDAIRNLNDAHLALPSDPGILADLAVAYAARGQATAEARTSDLGQAMEYLLQLRRRLPSDGRTLFNLGLIQEELSLVEEAADSWRQFLALNPETGWRNEAQRHLDELLRLIDRKKKADADIFKDPEKFLAAYDLNPALDPLPYFETFWMDWLPAMQTELRQGQSGPATLASRVVAQGFASRGELSLQDSLGYLGRDKNGALLRLAAVVRGNSGQDVEAPLLTAASTARDLSAAGFTSAAALAHIQAAFSFRRASRLSECRVQLEQPLRISAEKYRWLNAVAHLEHLACVEGEGEGDTARAEGKAAFDSASRHSLWPVALRSAVFLASIDAGIGNVAPVWDRAPRQMRDYWTTQANHLRLQGFLVYLADAAVAGGWNETAVLLLRSAARHAGLAGNYEMQATNYGTAASLLLSLGQRAEALEALRLAENLLGSNQGAPDGVRSNLWWDVQVALVEAQAGDPPASSPKTRISKLLESASNRDIRYRIRLHQADGLAHLKAGDSQAARAAFRAAIDLDQTLAEPLSWVDRIPIAELAGTSFRRLVQLQLESGSGPAKVNANADALATWLTYRPRARAASSHLAPNQISLTFADLSQGLYVFSETSAGVSVRRVEVPLPDIRLAARRFIALCGAPDSDPEAVNALGSRLYQWLLAPELNGHAAGVVSLSPGQWLAGLPWAALRDTNRSWLGTRFAFLQDYGPALRPSQAPARGPGLIVAAPTGAVPGGVSLPVLPDAKREAAAVAAHLPGATLLANASAADIGDRAPNLNLFHFTGHGWANGGNGALILPPAPDGSPRYLSAREIAGQDWSRCHLAVLSACLTAAGSQRGSVDNESLVNAFLSSGARNVVAAMWSVDSASTRALMEHFYASLKSGVAPAPALTAAAQEISHETRWSHPYYWAGFALFGAS